MPYSLFALLGLQISSCCFNSRLCQCCWFNGTLGVKSFPYLEDSPRGSNSMPGSIEAFICDLSSSLTIPARMTNMSLILLSIISWKDSISISPPPTPLLLRVCVCVWMSLSGNWIKSSRSTLDIKIDWTRSNLVLKWKKTMILDVLENLDLFIYLIAYVC